jgi:anti-sigma regulatory factor (Ser/Thr protein kinase)
MEANRVDRQDAGVFAGDGGSRGTVPDQDLIQEPSPAPLSRQFTRAQVTAVRHAVTRFAARSGLAGRRLEDFALAVNELVTNAVRHAGGQGRLRLWRADGRLCCEVTDEGPGIPADRVEPAPPPVSATDGRGLWLVSRLCDDVSIATGPAGTTVRIAAALSEQHLAAG